MRVAEVVEGGATGASISSAGRRPRRRTGLPRSRPVRRGRTPPAPQPAKAGDGADAATAKTESCFSTVGARQDGQDTASPKRRTSFSKCVPQSRQTYS